MAPTWTEMHEYGESQFRRGFEAAAFEYDLIQARRLEDACDWIAPTRLKAYQMLGGRARTLASYRAEVRASLEEGGDGF